MEYDIIICPSEIKTEIIKKITTISRPKFMTKQEFVSNFLFEINSDIRLKIYQEFNLMPHIIDEYLSAIHQYYFYGKGTSIKDFKEIFAFIKDDLEYNESFKDYLTNKFVGVYYYDAFLNDLLTGYNYELVKVPAVNSGLKLYEAESLDDEVEIVLTKIGWLTQNGVSLNDISLRVNDSSYYPVLNRKCNLYNIPLELTNRIKVSTLKIGAYLINSILNSRGLISEVVFNIVDNYVKEHEKMSNNDYQAISAVIAYFNNYSGTDYLISDFVEILTYDLNKLSIPGSSFEESLTLNNSSKEYQFLLGFNNEKFLSPIKSEGFLSSSEKERLGIETIINRNARLKQELVDMLSTTKNLFISYTTHHNGSEYHINECLHLSGREYGCFEINNTRFSEKDLLISKKVAVDDLKRLGVKTKALGTLVVDNSFIYDAQFKNFTAEFPEIKLSYSSMNMYNQCGFKYYLSKVIGINHFEESLALKIGNLYHHVYEDYFNGNNSNIDELMADFILNNSTTELERFYLEIQATNIVDSINVINTQMDRSKYEILALEANYEIEIEGVLFRGFIDKVLINREQNEYVVIDYKTGGYNLDLKKLTFGLDAQVLTYKLLLEEHVGDATCVGFFYQSILPSSPFKYVKDKSLSKQLENYMKLDGYILKNHSTIFNLDNEYREESYINKLKVKKDDSFYSTANVLTDEEMAEYKEDLITSIKETVKNIKLGYFTINPKDIDGKGINATSCGYCEFNDVCFKNNSHTVYLQTKDGDIDEE